MSEREIVPFGDLLSYPLRNGVTVPKEQRGSGIKMINMGELFRHPRLGDVDMALVDIDYQDRERFLVRQGDLLFARRSLTAEGAGKCTIVVEAPSETTWESSIIRARLNEDLADSLYYYYFFRSPLGRKAIGGITEQVAAAGIRSSDLRNLAVPKPTLEKQRSIAAVLGALDDKIAVNERIAHTCSQLARTLFRQAIEGPHRRTIPLGEIAVHKPGKYLSKDAYAAGGPYAVYGSNSVMGSHTQFLYEGGFSVLARIGSNCGSTRWSEFPAWVNNNASAIIPKDPADAMVLRHALEMVNMSPHRTGSGQPFIRVDSLMSSAVTVPAESVHQQISNRLKSLSRLETAAEPENRQLAQLRDALLPQLMSGRLRVKDAEKIVEEAT